MTAIKQDFLSHELIAYSACQTNPKLELVVISWKLVVLVILYDHYIRCILTVSTSCIKFKINLSISFISCFILVLQLFSTQVGNDAHGNLVADALRDGGVRLDYLAVVSSAPTGHAVVMLQSSGQNSIVIVGGANVSCWPQTLPPKQLEVVSSAGIVLLQREIPDFVNVQVAKVGTLDFLLKRFEIVFFFF